MSSASRSGAPSSHCRAAAPITGFRGSDTRTSRSSPVRRFVGSRAAPSASGRGSMRTPGRARRRCPRSGSACPRWPAAGRSARCYAPQVACERTGAVQPAALVVLVASHPGQRAMSEPEGAADHPRGCKVALAGDVRVRHREELDVLGEVPGAREHHAGVAAGGHPHHDIAGAGRRLDRGLDDGADELDRIGRGDRGNGPAGQIRRCSNVSSSSSWEGRSLLASRWQVSANG